MAGALVLSDFSDALSLIYQDDLIGQSRRDIVLLNLLAVKPGRNKTCTFRAKYDSRSAGGAYAEGADMHETNDYDSNARRIGSLSWAEYRTGAKVTGLAQAVHGASGGDGGGGSDLMDEEITDAIDKLALLLGAACYAGNHLASPVQLAGAALAIDASDDNFAGIDTGDNTWWASSEQTLATASLSISKLRTLLHRPVKDATGKDPEFVTCPGAIIDTLKDLLGTKADTIQEVRTNARGTVDIYAATGARAISVDGVPYVEDRHCTANTLYAWNSDSVCMRQIPAFKSRQDPNAIVQAVKMLTGVDVDVQEVEARLRARKGVLMPTIQFLSQTGDAVKAMVKAYCQLEWSRRNAFGKLTLT